jgi:hypothetical protein
MVDKLEQMMLQFISAQNFLEKGWLWARIMIVSIIITHKS